MRREALDIELVSAGVQPSADPLAAYRTSDPDDAARTWSRRRAALPTSRSAARRPPGRRARRPDPRAGPAPGRAGAVRPGLPGRRSRASSSGRSPGWSSGCSGWLIARPRPAPGGWLGILGLVLLIVVAVLLRPVADRPGEPLGGPDVHGRSRDERRAVPHARRGAGRAPGQWDEAVSERMRALVRGSQERGLIDAHPGWTADEVAAEVGRRVPDARDRHCWRRPGRSTRSGTADGPARRRPTRPIADADDRGGRRAAVGDAVSPGRPRRVPAAGARERAVRRCPAHPDRPRASPPAARRADHAGFDDTTWDRARRWRPTRRGLAIAALLLLALVVLDAHDLAPDRLPGSGGRGSRRVARGGQRAGRPGRPRHRRAHDGRRRGERRGATVLVTDVHPAHRRDDLRRPRCRPRPRGPGRPAAPAHRPSSGWRPGTRSLADRRRRRRSSPAAGGRPLSAPGAAELPGTRYDARAWVPAGQACYDSPESAAVVVIPARAGRPEVVLLGSAHPLTNEGFDAQGNAALALSLLGSRERAGLVAAGRRATRPWPGRPSATIRELLPDLGRPGPDRRSWSPACWWRGGARAGSGAW